MARAYKLERIIIPDASRVTKDWFPTRESADAAIPLIRTHLQATGETYTWAGHTHTRPPEGAVPVYIGSFELPDRYVKLKRLAPCPCCWDEAPKFGHGKIAWFEDERVIRLIGPQCFRSLNPEAHEHAQSTYEIEQEQKSNTDFLLKNLPQLAQVVKIIDRAHTVACALETFHAELHHKLPAVQLKLWQHVRRNGELSVNLQEKEFRRGEDGEMYSHDIEVQRVQWRLSGYEMLGSPLEPLSSPLENALNKIEPYNTGQDAQAAVEAMDHPQRQQVAAILSRCVKNAKDKIARIEVLRGFTKRVEINTLRNWGTHEGCPLTLYCSHDGESIAFGRREHNTVNIQLPQNINLDIGEIKFWVEREKWRR
jgi:hypothetical protein